MDTTELKKILAGLSIVGLLTVSTLGMTGCATSGKSSCTGDKEGSTEMQEERTGEKNSGGS